MTTFAALYTDEDMSALVATLLRSRGLDVATVPEQATFGKTDGDQKVPARNHLPALAPSVCLASTMRLLMHEVWRSPDFNSSSHSTS